MLRRIATDFTAESINTAKNVTQIDLGHEMRSICRPTAIPMKRNSSTVVRRHRQRYLPTHSVQSNQNYRSQSNQLLELSEYVCVLFREPIIIILG